MVTAVVSQPAELSSWPGTGIQVTQVTGGDATGLAGLFAGVFLAVTGVRPVTPGCPSPGGSGEPWGEFADPLACPSTLGIDGGGNEAPTEDETRIEDDRAGGNAPEALVFQWGGSPPAVYAAPTAYAAPAVHAAPTVHAPLGGVAEPLPAHGEGAPEIMRPGAAPARPANPESAGEAIRAATVATSDLEPAASFHAEASMTAAGRCPTEPAGMVAAGAADRTGSGDSGGDHGGKADRGTGGDPRSDPDAGRTHDSLSLRGLQGESGGETSRPAARAESDPTAGIRHGEKAFSREFWRGIGRELVERALLAPNHSGGTTVELALRPEHLGKLHVRLHWDAGSLRAQLITDNAAGHSLVQENLPLLRDALDRHGINIGGLEVALGDRDNGRAGEQPYRPETFASEGAARDAWSRRTSSNAAGRTTADRRGLLDLLA